MLLSGKEPVWIWAFTCPVPACDCRRAVVLSTKGGREMLVERGAPVREAWLRGGGSYPRVAAALEDVTAFAVDIDDGEIYPVYGEDSDDALDFDAHPEAREIADRMDGETLEACGHLWYRGKGLPDPEVESPIALEITLRDWEPGQVVAWGEAIVEVRQDLFRFGEREFDAIDLYCVALGCTCGEVVVDFAIVSPPGAPDPGEVRLSQLGEPTILPEHETHRALLEQLWAAFQKRHPRYRERFARRSTVMQSLAGRIVGEPPAAQKRARAAKVGRNDPCPCKSGKKHKKCCGVN
jgi:SEC-C motif